LPYQVRTGQARNAPVFLNYTIDAQILSAEQSEDGKEQSHHRHRPCKPRAPFNN